MTRRITACIAVEGVQTWDGRFIEVGALTWEAPMPVFLMYMEPNYQLDRFRIGTIIRARRAGRLIMADLDFYDGPDLSGQVALCMDIDRIEMGEDDPDGGDYPLPVIVGGRIRDVVVHGNPNNAVWPECVVDLGEEQ